MNRRSLFTFFSAADADERRARAWLACVGLAAAIALLAIAGNPAHSESGTAVTMRNHIDDWLAADWVVLGAYVPHWAVALAAVALAARLVARFERPKRGRETDLRKAA